MKRKCRKLSEEHKKKISEAKKGTIHSEETKRKISQSRKKYFENNNEARQKLSDRLKEIYSFYKEHNNNLD